MSNLQALRINELKNNNLSVNQQYKLIEEEKTNAEKLYSQLTTALVKNKITIKEHDYAIRKLAAGMHEKEFKAFIEKKLLELEDKKKKLRVKRTRQVKAAAYLFGLIILIFTGLIIQGNPKITGFGTYVDKINTEQVNYNFTNNSLALNYTNSSTFKISGYIEGIGTAKIFINNNEELLVYEDNINDNNEGIISTNKKYYLTGEEIQVNVKDAELESKINNSINSSINSSMNNSNLNDSINSSINKTINSTNNTPTYTLYTSSNLETINRKTNAFTINEPGTYEVYALIDNNGLITKESTSIEVVNSLLDIKKDFSEACINTCTLNNININSISALTTGNVKIIITKIMTTNKALNTPPRLIKNFENISITQGMSITKNLNDYFMDDEGQELIFDVSSEAAKIENDTLIISGQPGVYQATIYASDSLEITESNTFTIHILESQIPINISNNNNTGNNNTNNYNNTTNNTNNTQINIEVINNNTEPSMNYTNETIITQTINTSNMTYQEIKALGLCDDPNPNNIPVACLEGNVKKFFPETNVYIENLDGKVIARITPIGNMMIKGKVIYESSSAPGSRDFKLGYVDDLGGFYPTSWINSETGDLHLQGSVEEELIDITIPSNVYSFRNKRGVNLGYINKNKGSLYLRGNLITERGDLE